MQTPSVGRVVHYQAFGTPGGEYKSVPRAAIVTAVQAPFEGPPNSEIDFKVSLCILNPTGMFFNEDVRYSAEPKAGHWNWPPFVPAKKD